MHKVASMIGSASEDRRTIWLLTLGLTGAIAAADLAISGVSVGILYVIPVILASLILTRGKILAIALFATVLRETLGPMSWNEDAGARMSAGLVVFILAGFLISEMRLNFRLARQHVDQLEEAVRLQRDAENESRQLVEGSPGAILTCGADGQILMANDAARQLLGSDSLAGEAVTRFLPMLAPLLARVQDITLVRTVVEGGARRASGEGFFAQMWLSSYQTGSGLRIAIVFSDATEILRDREEMGLRQLMMSSRIAAAAVSHEVRNLSNSAYRLFRKIGNEAGLAVNEDYNALSSLLDGMRKLTAEELKPSVEELKRGADVNQVLQELLLILEPSLRETNTTLDWHVDRNLPEVRADHSGLLQVLLNLAQNAQRALSDKEDKRLSIVAYPMNQSVIVRFSNNGNPISEGDRLFEPLQPKATATGLGLFISRAILRTYGGELQYAPGGEGCMFLITLPMASWCKEPGDA